MIIKQQLPPIGAFNQPINPTGTSNGEQNPAAVNETETSSPGEIRDIVDISHQKATVNENLSAISIPVSGSEMASGLMNMLKGQVETNAGKAVQAQAGGIRPDALRLLED